MKKLVFTERYSNRVRQFLRAHPEVETQYAKALQILQINPHHPSLRPQAFQGRLVGVQTIYLSTISLEMLLNEDQVVLLNIASNQLD